MIRDESPVDCLLSLQWDTENSYAGIALEDQEHVGKIVPSLDDGSALLTMNHALPLVSSNTASVSKRGIQEESPIGWPLFSGWDTDNGYPAINLEEQEHFREMAHFVGDQSNDDDDSALLPMNYTPYLVSLDTASMPIGRANAATDGGYSSGCRQHTAAHYYPSPFSHVTDTFLTVPSLATSPIFLGDYLSPPSLSGHVTPVTPVAFAMPLDTELLYSGLLTGSQYRKLQDQRPLKRESGMVPKGPGLSRQQTVHNTGHSSAGTAGTRASTPTTSSHDGNKELSSPLLPPLLHVAARLQNHSVLTTLLKHGAAKVDDRGQHGCTALHIAVELSDKALVMLLLRHGANASLCDANGHSALYLAVLKGQNDILKLLLGHTRTNNLATKND
jgi:hypothetical protein